jgi:FkbM family methyltransferase
VSIIPREPARKARKLVRILRRRTYRRALRRGVAATVEHEGVPFDPHCRTVIDVGAGRGQFAVFALDRFPDAEIFCFEPLPSSYATACRALGESNRMHLRRVAIGQLEGTSRLFVTADADSSSLRAPTAEQARSFAGTSTFGEAEVEVETLDRALGVVTRPALLKLDVQGGELEVLAGAGRVLESVDEVFAECSFVELYRGQPLAEDVIAYLAARGFKLAGIFSASYGDGGACIQADLLFRRC